MAKDSVSADFHFKSNYVDVIDSKMHYIEQGSGNPILFLHGMPTSAYIWRNVIPHLSTLGRCIAPDLMGMGKSDKPKIEYSIEDHIKYIDKFIEIMGLKRVTLVMHGWGSIIGFDYAMRHEKNCRGLVFYESYLRPTMQNDLSLPFQQQLAILDDHQEFDDVIVHGAKFVDQVLPLGMLRTLSEKEMSIYREPFLAEGSGKPLHQYLQELPRGNGTGKVDQLISEYSKKLQKSQLPKLLLYSIPGYITTIATVMWAKEHLPKLEIAEVGEAMHYAQESNPSLMGETISIWLQGIEQTV